MCVCVGEGRAGQEKRGEEKVDTTQKTQENRTKKVNKRGGNMVIIVSDNTKNGKKHWKITKTRSPFWARYGQQWTQKGPKTVIFPDALFSRFPNVLPTFSDMEPIPNDQNPPFRERGPS